MKKKILLLAALFPLLLTSCSSKNKNAIVVAQSLDNDYVVSINTDQLIDMMDAKLSFVLYFYSSVCSHCIEVSAYFERYYNDNPLSFYRYDLHENGSTYEKLVEYDPAFFPENNYTPRVFIFKNGYRTDEVANQKLISYSYFKGAIDSFTIKKDNLYTTTDELRYNSFMSSHPDAVSIFYNSKTKDNVDKYLEIYNMETIEKPTIVVDLAFYQIIESN